MKIMPLKSLLFCSALLFASVAQGYGNPDTVTYNEDAPEALSSQIGRLLVNPQLEYHGIEKARVRVQFRLDEERRIKVVEVGAPEHYLKRFIEQRLNGEKLKVDGLQPDTDYFIDLRFNLI